MSTLTGTDCLVVVVSESGLLYTFSTPALSGVTDHPRGREFLEAALRGEIRGDGTGDFDFTAGNGPVLGSAHEASARADEAGAGAGLRGERRRRGAAGTPSTTAATATDGTARMVAIADEEGPPPDFGGISVGTGPPDAFQAGGQAYAHHHHHHPQDGDGAEFHLDPALHGLDLPVPPMSYSHHHQEANAHQDHHQHQHHQQQLFDLFNFGGAGGAGGGGGSGGGDDDNPGHVPGGGVSGSTGNANPSSVVGPHAYSSYPTSFFSPQQQQQQQAQHPHLAHLASHHSHPTGSGSSALDDLAFATSSASSASHHAAVAASLFDHGSLGFPLGVGTTPAPSEAAGAAFSPPGPFPPSGSAVGPLLHPTTATAATTTTAMESTDREAIARAHELATKSYRAALSAAEAYVSPSSPSAASSTSTTSSSSSSTTAAAAAAAIATASGSPPHLGPAADPTEGPLEVGKGKHKGRGRKRSAAAALPVDASQMGWGETLTIAATTRRVRPRVEGGAQVEGHEPTPTDEGARGTQGEAEEEEAEEEETAAERKVRWQREARKALKEAQKVSPSPPLAEALCSLLFAPNPPPRTST